MKILVDYQAFLIQKYGGISKYHATINRFINEIGDANDTSTILQLGSKNEYVEPSHYDWFFKKLNRKGGRRWLFMANKALTKANLKNFDVFHPSYYDSYFLETATLPPYVVTIHDMIAEKYYPKGRELQAANKKKVVDNASAVIAISEATKNDLIGFYKYPIDKVHVIYHGYPDYFEKYKGASEKLNLTPYILFVGVRNDYKNFNFFLEAFHKLIQRYKVQLRVVGSPFTADEIKLITELKLVNEIISENFVSEEVLSSLYRQALCFVYPSLIEGFGMPILEAFISDCPVICTDISVFREIAANAALYFEIGNIDSLVFTMENIIINTELRTTLITNGHRRLKIFDWKKNAASTLAVYRSVLNK